MKSELHHTYDLSNCEKEPIRTPGSIQPHGLLFGLSEPDLRILFLSDNAQPLLGIESQSLIRTQLEDLVEPKDFKSLKEKLNDEDLLRHNPMRITLKFGPRSTFDGIAHRQNNILILELEPLEVLNPFEFAGFYHQARKSVQVLRAAKNIAELYSHTVKEVQRITRFDRVLIYKFDEHWNGHVLAEEKSAAIQNPYLDMHFPSTDIPAQVRDLYLTNHLRIIPTTDSKVSQIIGTDQKIDLSFAVLRSVSPVHIQYMRNMNTTASMSMAVIKNNRLWGLISCNHESGSMYLPFDVRALCDFLAETFSSLLPMHEVEVDTSYKLSLAQIQTRLIHSMSSNEDFIEGLLSHPEDYLQLGDATGGAIYFGGKFYLMGLTPSDSQLKDLIDWLLDKDGDPVFSTTSLSQLFPRSEAYKDSACGLAAFSISKAHANYFLWFRAEKIHTVNWGGNRHVAGDTQTLHPRKSFEVWKETVQLKSFQWREVEMNALKDFRSAVIDIVLQRVERITTLNTELERSNNELDSFAYAASHDLKEPLRGIHNYATFLLKKEEGLIPLHAVERLDKIVKLTERSENLINSLLHYSQVGRAELTIRESDTNQIVKNALESLRVLIEEKKAHIEVQEDLPSITCDRVLINEVFTNLVSNALKYNLSPSKSVVIGSIRGKSGEDVFFVRDNGIGIDSNYHTAIFKIFKRLHAKEKFGGGTGTGLTITRKIIERHNGTIWLDSNVNEGTTFYFTMSDDIHVGQ